MRFVVAGAFLMVTSLAHDAQLNVGADYGMIVLKDAPAPAAELARYMLGEPGQEILTKYGFGRGEPAK